MRTSAKITLVVSICLLVLGLGLVFFGIKTSFVQPQVVNYQGHGFSYSYSSYYYSSQNSFSGQMLLQFGKLSFFAGLVTMFIFVYLACHEGKKINKDQEQPVNNTAKPQETKAETVDAEKKSEVVTPHVIELGPGNNTEEKQEEVDKTE